MWYNMPERRECVLIYIISCDLHAPANNRSEVEAAIDSLGVYRKLLFNTYLVKSSMETFEVQNIVTRPLYQKDRMIICHVTKPIAGCLTEEEWSWIKNDL
jgi:hypothetical protein